MNRISIQQGDLQRNKNYNIIQEAINIDFVGEISLETKDYERINFSNCTFDKLLIRGGRTIPITLIGCECKEIFITGQVGVINLNGFKECEKIEFTNIHTEKVNIKDSKISRVAYSFDGKDGYIKESEVNQCDVKEFIANVQMDLLRVRGRTNIKSFHSGDKLKHCSIFEGGNVLINIYGGSLKVGEDCSVFLSKITCDNFVCHMQGEKSHLAIHNSSINTMHLKAHKTRRSGIFQLNSCSVNSFNIYEGVIERIYLNNVDLSNTHIDFRNQIEREDFSWDNVTWPMDLLAYLNINGYDDGRKTIRSLKQKAKSIDDKFSILLFNSLELKHKFESLRVKIWPPELRSYNVRPKPTKTKVFFLKVYWWISNPVFDLIYLIIRKRLNYPMQDRIVLYISRYSNNFGMDWFRAILFTSIGAGIIFYFYGLSLSPQPFVFGWDGWSNYWVVFNENFKYYLRFLNPTHDFDLIKNYDVNSMACFWDFLSRIYISFGYYQVIKAFRKLF